MKLLHLPYCYYPDPVGGTEVYVQALAKIQRSRGLRVEIAAPSSENATYKYDDIPVHRFAVKPDLTLRELHGHDDRVAAEGFWAIARKSRPDIVQMHGMTSALSSHIAVAAQSLGIPVVLTCHTPAVVCGRGTLLRFGREVCDGAISVGRCSACTLHGHGLQRAASTLVSHIPAKVSGIFAALPWSGAVRTALATPNLTALRKQAVNELFERVNHIVAVCDWMKRVLVRNGVSEKKITVCRQGLPFPGAKVEPFEANSGAPLRVAFVGRLSASKGVLELVQAVLAGSADLTLDIYGIVQGGEGERIRHTLLAMSKRDPRIRLLPPVMAGQIVPTLAQYDLLAVPSQCLETGPLVVHEAFAAGIPVVGSDLGGIAELVQNGVNGLLVRHDSRQGWIRALESLAHDRDLLSKLRSNLPRARTMNDAATEMMPLYERLAGSLLAAAGSLA